MDGVDDSQSHNRFMALWGVLAALVVAAVGCGGAGGGSQAQDAAAAGGEGVFVGAVEGSDTYLALISDGEQVTGYLCDSDQISRWLDSTEIDDDTVELVTRDGEVLGTAQLTDDGGVEGEIDLDGATRAFDLEPASGEGGLYRATVEGGGQLGAEAGWIVLADGAQRGATNQFVQSGVDIAVEPAPALDPAAPTVQLGAASAPAHKLTPGFISRDDGDEP